MITEATATTELAVFHRIIDPIKPLLSRKAAEAFLSFELPAEDKDRLKFLAERSRSGQITDAERREIDVYSRVGGILTILKSKARRTLGRPVPGRRKKVAADE